MVRARLSPNRIAGTAILCALALLAGSARAADPFAAAAQHYQQGRWAEAAAEFERIRASGATPEQRNVATFYLGECRMQGEDFAAARAAYQAFLRAAPQHKHATSATFRLAEAAYLQGNRSAAQAELASFVAANPQDARVPIALAFLGHLALQQGNGPTARQWLERAARDFPQGPLAQERAQWLARAKELTTPRGGNPSGGDNVAAEREQARTLLRQQRFAEAVAAFEKLVTRPNRDPAGDASTGISQDRYWLALAYLGSKQHAQALSALESVELTGAEDELVAGIELARATALLALHRDEDAIGPLKAYLQRLPAGQHAALCRADLTTTLARLGRWPDAAQAESEYSAKHPNDPRRAAILAALAEAALAAEEWDHARRWCEVVVALDPTSAAAKAAATDLAWIDARTARPAEAAAALHKYLEQFPTGRWAGQAALRLAAVREAAGEFDAALATYRRVLDGPTETPEYPYALLGAASLHDRLAQDREADQLLAQLARDFPDFAERDRLLYVWGWVLQDLDRQEEALAAWRKLHDEFRASRRWAEATYWLAEHELLSQRLPQARALAQEVVDAKPLPAILARALLLLGQAAAMERNWTLARPPLERVLRDFSEMPQAAPAEFWLAEADYRTAQWASAAARLERLARRIGNGQEPWMAMIPLRRAQLLARAERWVEAREMAASVRQRFPEFRQQYEADYVLGRAAAALGEFAAAREAYERVLASPQGAKTETAAMSQWMIGETYFHQQRWEEALKAYQRVEILYPFPAWQAAALLQAGKCLEQKGEWREATKLYGRLLEQYAQTSYAHDARRRMEIARQRENRNPEPKPR